MNNKDLIIIALIVVIVYLAYQNQASSQSPLIVESPITQQLRSELNHYQTLYENRVKKDLGFENKEAETQTDLSQEQISLFTEISQGVLNWVQELGINPNQKWNLTLLKDKVNEFSGKQHQEQLRKINVLFDDKANSYETIDFNGLYSLLSSIAERERERESKSSDDENGWDTAEE